MELAVYIQIKTDDIAAQLFGVKKRTVGSWRRMERVPTPLQSLRIIEKTKGTVDWQGIYLPYAKYRKRKKDQLTPKKPLVATDDAAKTEKPFERR